MNNKNHVSWNQTFAIMVVIFAVLGLTLSQLNLLPSITAWVALLGFSLVFSLAIKIYTGRSSKNTPTPQTGDQSGTREGYSYKEILLVILPFLVIVPGIFSKLISVRMQVSAHGYLHLGYINQILNNQIPPDNPLLPGYPANYYWYYHALLAALSKVFNTAAPLVSSILAFVILAFTLGLIKELVGYLLVEEKRPAILMLLAFFGLFGMNLFGTIHTIMRFSPAEKTIAAIINALAPTPLFGDPRLTVIFGKYLAFTGVPQGVLAYILVLLIVIRALSGGLRRTDFLLAIMASFAALALHSIDAVFIFVTVPTALFVTYVANAFSQGKTVNFTYHKKQIISAWGYAKKEWKWTLSTLLISGLVGIAALRFIFSASGESTISFELISTYALQSVFSMTYPLIPFFFIGAYWGFKKGDSRLIFLITLSIVGMAMGYFIRFASNEYKFIYLASIAVCLVSVVPLWQYVFKPGEKRSKLGHYWGILMLALMFVNVVALGMSRITHPWVASENFVYQNIHINSRSAYEGTPDPEVEIPWATDSSGNPYPSDIHFADIFQWARENTPESALLVVPHTHREVSSLYALSERLPYVVDGEQMNNTLPDYPQRVEQVYALYHPDTPEDMQMSLEKINETLQDQDKYLLYPAPGSDLLSDPGNYGLELVYEGRYGNLFHIMQE